jgi:hypothetical protein
MVAALLRVVHGGLQDSRLLCRKGQPNISFFIKAFVRAGRFTTQFARIDFDTVPSLGNTSTVTLPRKGHLISRIYMVTTMPDIGTPQKAAQAAAVAAGKPFAGPTFGWTNSLGHALVSQATITIGGARVEQLDGRLLEVMDEFYGPLEKMELTNKLLQRDPSAYTTGRFGLDSQTQAVTPLPFWFSCGDAGAFLPIDAIQADQVKLSITFSALNTLYTSDARLNVPSGTVAVGGDAYFPLAGSPFYMQDPSGQLVAGLTGNPGVTTRVSPIPGIQIPTAPLLGDTYFMVEYVYLDKPEANRFRLADIQIPVIQHYAFNPVDTKAAAQANCRLKVPNPTRNLFFYLQRFEAPYYNAPFLATRDLTGPDASGTPWWPNASRIDPRIFTELVPGFVFRNSEPLSSLSLIYEGSLFRYTTVAPSLFRSVLPSLEQRKSPWINRYYYNLPFGLYSGSLPPSIQAGEANLDRIVNINLQLDLHPFAGYVDPNAVPRYLVYVWAETYNILRVYGGRAGMMFAY